MTVALGASLDDALAALGEPASSVTVDVLGIETTTKMWLTVNFFRLSSSETVTFTDGVATSVMSTADAFSSISAADFARVSSGMSEQEVFEILGAPYSVTTVGFMGLVSVTVSWVNADSGSGTVTFTDGRVSSTLASELG